MIRGRLPAYLALEFAALFLALPFAVAYGLSEAHLLIIPALLSASLLCLALLMLDPSFDRKRVWNMAGFVHDAPRIMIMFIAGALLMAAFVWYSDREAFFALPRKHTAVWLLIMIFYPVISVPPQELIYRVFLFHRYRTLLPLPALLLASTVTFSLAHIVFGNAMAILLTLGGGLLFAYTYYRTRSLAAVSVEHALYGCMVFTVGLGESLLFGTRLMIERLTGSG